jgi:hypothetical protein
LLEIQMTDAQFNLLQLEQRPNWYDHLGQVEQAMAHEQDVWALRKDYGWDGDDGGEWGPNPLDPDTFVLEQDWEDTLGLPFPEDFQSSDSYVYELMVTIGKYKDDPAVMAHMVALRAADYLGNLGEPQLGAIRGQLRTSYIVEHAND